MLGHVAAYTTVDKDPQTGEEEGVLGTHTAADDFVLAAPTLVKGFEVAGIFLTSGLKPHDSPVQPHKINAVFVSIYAAGKDGPPGECYAFLTFRANDERLSIRMGDGIKETPKHLQADKEAWPNVRGQIVRIFVDSHEPLLLLPAGRWYVSVVVDTDDSYHWLASAHPNTDGDSPLWWRVAAEGTPDNPALAGVRTVTDWQPCTEIHNLGKKWNLAFKIRGHAE
jgi:hypothetical protein